MKVLVTTALCLGIIVALESVQPAQAVIDQSPITTSHQSQITPARWHHHRGPGIYLGDPWAYPYGYNPYYQPPVTIRLF